MSSTIAGKQTLGIASPRSAKKKIQQPEYYGYGGAASDNGAALSKIEKFEESKYNKSSPNGKQKRRIRSASKGGGAGSI